MRAKNDSTFVDLVGEALANCNNAQWLGQHSKLASPYFLGNRLSTIVDAGDPKLQRGVALQSLLEETFFALIAPHKPRTFDELSDLVKASRQAIGNKGPIYHFFILELLFFKRYFRAGKYAEKQSEIAKRLSVSTTRFYVSRKLAIALFAETLLKLCHPTSRLEQPYHEKTLFGRNQTLSTILNNLKQGQSISITGNGGVGKTALAIAIRNQWPHNTTFWYTIRPQLNDNILDFLFAFGHFLQQVGQTKLWRQLLADQSRIASVEQILGFMRLDLQALQQPLAIIDEVDLLESIHDRPERAASVRLRELIEAMRAEVPLLLVGQQATIDTAVHLRLDGLSLDHTRTMLSEAQVALSLRDAKRLHNATTGNPRLLELVLALIDVQDELPILIKLLEKGSARPLFLRLLKRLSAEEKNLICLLSVFRSYIPASELSDFQVQIDQLRERHILQEDAAGGCALLPYLRLLAYDELSVDLKETLHDYAAAIRTHMGEFTPAVHHLVAANRSARAIDFWYSKMATEIERGQAAQATQVFSHVSSKGLETSSLRRLKIIQNELSLLNGDAEAVVMNLQGTDWLQNSFEDAKLYQQLALAQKRLNNADRALEHYDTAIEMLDETVFLLISSYQEHSRMRLRNPDPNKNADYNRLADVEFTVAVYKGFLADAVRDLPEAAKQYHVAVTHAEAAERPVWIAQSHYLLATVLSQQGNFVEAQPLYEQAMTIFGEHGDLFRQEYVRAEYAGMFINARKFAKALPLLEKNLQFFQQVNEERRVATTSNNLAEAYFELGELEKAKAMVNSVLRLEVMRSRPYAMYTLGLIHQQEGNTSFAETAFEDGIRIAQETSDRFIEAYLHRNLGNLHTQEKKYPLAMSCLEKAQSLFEQIGNKSELAKAQEEITQLAPLIAERE